MAQLHYHPDGIVFIRGGASLYSAPLAVFLSEAAVIVPDVDLTLPTGATERLYDRGNRHFLVVNGVMESQPLSWSPGNAVLNKTADFLTKQDHRVPDPVPLAPYWTAREFMALFTDAELLAIVQAKKTNDVLEIWWTKAAAGPVERDHPDTAAGLDYLISLELITTDRKTEILGD